jgi:hypothetical protein
VVRLTGWAVPKMAIHNLREASFAGTASASKPVDRRYHVLVVVNTPL